MNWEEWMHQRITVGMKAAKWAGKDITELTTEDVAAWAETQGLSPEDEQSIKDLLDDE